MPILFEIFLQTDKIISKTEFGNVTSKALTSCPLKDKFSSDNGLNFDRAINLRALRVITACR